MYGIFFISSKFLKSNCLVASDSKFLSFGEKRDVPKQSCLRKVSSLPATDYTEAFTIKDETQEEKPLRRNRVSYDCMLNDKDQTDTSFFFAGSDCYNNK